MRRPKRQGFWDIARDHYGSHTPMLTYRSTAQVIRALTEGHAAIGVLPMPAEEDPDPWWRHLLSTDENAPHVIARLPFGARGNARSDSADALAIGHGGQQETGRDRTLIATENAPDISRGRMFATLSALGLACTFMASCEHAEGVNTLIEIDGFVPMSDPRLDRLREQLGPALYRLLGFGGYAVPLSAAELSPPRIAQVPTRPVASPPQQKVEPMTTATAPVPGPGILDIAPYVGGEAKAPGIERPIRLASNESALGPSPKAVAAYRALAQEIHRYPDGSAAELRAALGRLTSSIRSASCAAPVRMS